MQGTETKAKEFAKAYVANGFEAAPAYRAIKPDVKQVSSYELASRMLRKDDTKKAIAEVLAEQGLNDEVATKIHKENLTQRENLPASNTALEMYHKLQGRLRSETTHNHLHLHADIKDVDLKLKAVQDEMKELGL